MAIFGDQRTNNGGRSVEDQIQGTLFPMGVVVGVGISITAQVMCYTAVRKFKCAIYDEDENILQNSITEEKSITTTGIYHSETFNFGITRPILKAHTNYYLVTWCDNGGGGGGGGALASIGDTTKTVDKYDEAYNGFPASVTFDLLRDDFTALIYCTYEELQTITITDGMVTDGFMKT